MADDRRNQEQVTGGMRSDGPDGEASRDPQADLWGAAEAEDMQDGLADVGEVSPDEAAEILFGDEAQEVRAAHHEHQEDHGEEDPDAGAEEAP